MSSNVQKSTDMKILMKTWKTISLKKLIQLSVFKDWQKWLQIQIDSTIAIMVKMEEFLISCNLNLRIMDQNSTVN